MGAPYYARFINKPKHPFSYLLLSKAEKLEAKDKKKSTETEQKVAEDSIKKESFNRKINKIVIPKKAI